MFWPKTIGPMTGMSCIPEGRNAWKVFAAGWSASFRSFPRYDDRPAAPAKIVSARPDTIWLARSVMTRNAWIAAMIVPAERRDHECEHERHGECRRAHGSPSRSP